MTYNAREISSEAGKPFFLYEFVTPAQSYYFTDQAVSILHNSQTWLPTPVTHTEIRASSEISKNGTKIKMPLGLAFTDLFLDWPIDFVTTVTIYRGHIGEAEVLAYWKGRIVLSSPKDQTIEFSCESVFTSVRRTGLRARFQRSCRHALYHSGCNLNKADFLVLAEVTAASGQVLTVTEASLQPDGWYVGGIVEWADNSTSLISGHVGNQITISRPSRYLIDYIAGAGAIPFTINLYPGCDRTLATCRDKFNNLVNQGGFKFVPRKNPFGGSSII